MTPKKGVTIKDGGNDHKESASMAVSPLSPSVSGSNKGREKANNYKCVCGFQFARPGEFRNSNAFIDKEGNSWIVCPKCGKKYKT